MKIIWVEVICLDNIRQKVIDVLDSLKVFDISADSFKEDENLYENGMDSTAFIQMIVELESVFEIEIPYEDIDDLSTISSIVNVIEEIHN